MSKLDKPLSVNALSFIEEYLAVQPRNAYATYRRVFACTEKTAAVNSARLMADPRVKAELLKRGEATRERFQMQADDVFREIFLVAMADPRELSEHYVGACRHCHGDGFGYQRTPNELCKDYEQFLAHEAKKAKAGEEAPGTFNMLGGVGFNAHAAPHAACPECHGDGVGYEVFKDTRTLSPAAARLYSGVKKTREGLEIKTRSQDKALEMAAQTLGLFKTRTELSGPDGRPIGIASASVAVPLPENAIEAQKIYMQLINGKS